MRLIGAFTLNTPRLNVAAAGAISNSGAAHAQAFAQAGSAFVQIQKHPFLPAINAGPLVCQQYNLQYVQRQIPQQQRQQQQRQQQQQQLSNNDDIVRDLLSHIDELEQQQIIKNQIYQREIEEMRSQINQLRQQQRQNSSACNICSICRETIRPRNRSNHCLPCGHIFHGICIERWLENHETCPVCRQPVSNE